MPIKGIDALVKDLNKAVDDLEVAACTELKLALHDALETALGNTPVWSGESVANYHVGVARTEGHVTPIGEGKNTKEQTSKLPLGAEENRPANEELARASLGRYTANVSKTLPKAPVEIYSTLAPEKADLIDNGAAPTPATARNKGGVMKLAAQAVRTRRNGNWS